MILPSAVEYARRWPSSELENTTPGMAVTAADCAGLHGRRVPQPGGGVCQMRSPLSTRSAKRPPPFVGSTSETASLPPLILVLRNSMSDNAAYILRPSVAEPHWMPPTVPPLPSRDCHSIFPRLSGSIP